MMILSFQSKLNINYDKTSFLNNLLIENFLLHSRGLMEFYFFDIKKFKDDDVLASDLIANWKKLRPYEYKDVEYIKKRIDKELAHLTWSRKDPNDITRNWDLNEIFNILSHTTKIFINNLSKNLINKKITELKEMIQ